MGEEPTYPVLEGTPDNPGPRRRMFTFDDLIIHF